MADIDATSPSATDEATETRIESFRAVVRDVVRHGGGELLDTGSDAILAAFQSAVAVMRAAVDMQETLRVRNKALSLAERIDVRLGIAIAEVPAGEGEVPSETIATASALCGRASPGGLCISQSVREAVAGKLNLAFQPVLPDGTALDGQAPATYRVAVERGEQKEQKGRSALRWPQAPAEIAGMAGALALVGAASWWLIARPEPAPTQTAEVRPVAASKTPAASPPPGVERKPASGGGSLVFKPAHAPDPSAVLSAKRMLPNAWRDCESGAPAAAVDGCQLLIDSGLAQGAELAEYHLRQGKALRDRGDFDRALASMTAAISLAPTSTAYALRGTVHYKKKNLEPAIADYTEAIRRDANNGEALNNRAWTYYRLERAREGLPDADAAVRLLGKEAYVWDTRAHIHAALGNRDAAISDFRKALTIDPAFADSKTGLAKLGVQ